jgi:hypothetical protein
MKKLFFILLLFPILLVAQNVQSFKIGKCKPALYIDSVYYEDTASVAMWHIEKGARLEMRWCSDSSNITSFNVELYAKNLTQTVTVLGTEFPQDLIDFIKQKCQDIAAGDEPILSIRKLTYTSKNKSTHKIEGSILAIRIVQ